MLATEVSGMHTYWRYVGIGWRLSLDVLRPLYTNN